MARYFEVGPPVNDGEREVLRVLRDGLDDEWAVVANFEIEQGRRAYECDALVVGPLGWAYLVETKAWTGRIRGNDQQWELPSLVGGASSYRPNPLNVTTQKSRILKDLLVRENVLMKGLFIQPVVAIAGSGPLELEGRCAGSAVLIDDLLGHIAIDPRPFIPRSAEALPADTPGEAADLLRRTARPIAPSTRLGSWELLELVDEGGRGAWQVWSALPAAGGPGVGPLRLKRYRLDPLLTGPLAEAQRQRVRRDLDALGRLAGVGGAVPLVGGVEEVDDEFVVVTPWPRGESLASLLANGPLSEEDATDVYLALVRAVASIHGAGVIHRNLSPRCAHLLRDGRVVLTDFDYARLPDAGAGFTELIRDELEGEYLAPEVRADPSSVTKASDVWSLARIGAALFGATTIDLSRIPDAWQESFVTALVAAPDGRTEDAGLLLLQLESPAPPAELLRELQPNDILDERFVVREHPVGEGGISRVYRVFDTLTSQDYAAKFIRPEFEAEIDPAAEYQLLQDLPRCPYIVRPEMPIRISSVRRGKSRFERKAVFLPTKWIDGTSLDQLISDKMPPARVVELGIDIAEGLQLLHSNGIIHRDLKPQNIILNPEDGTPRIVDFNVSQIEDQATHTVTGTPRYRAPDLPEAGWGRDADLYGLGVILSELLAAKPLGAINVQDWLSEGGTGIFEQAPLLKAALGTATEPTRQARYHSAEEFAADLRRALDELRTRLITSTDEFPIAPVEEEQRENWNPYIPQLVSLFSQSRTSNAGTRGLDDFSRWAYVHTKIDRDLYLRIVSGQMRLVLITGNAGDGKTAFIQMVERRLHSEGAIVQPRDGGNGIVARVAERHFETNWDGSQDEGDRSNDDALLDFFSPFSGTDPNPPPNHTRIIAINEGRLLDFLAKHRAGYSWLERVIGQLYSSATDEVPDWLAIVNLNLRALTLPGDDEDSIVSRLLAKFSDPRLWTPCESCRIKSDCYARANAQVLADPILGPRSAERIRQALDIVRLRRLLHITMRDLRSALAFILAGNRTCDQIVELVDTQETKTLLAGQLYNSLFAASLSAGPSAHAEDAANDRLLYQVGFLDVARTSSPEDDSRLWTLGTSALRADPTGITRNDRSMLEELRTRLPLDGGELRASSAQEEVRFVHASLRRKLFLEREDPGWLTMLPFSRLSQFMRQLRAPAPEDREALALAISASEGLAESYSRGHVAVRLAQEGEGGDRSFVIHEVSDFVVESENMRALALYVEYQPDLLVFRHKKRGDILLEIDVDLFESLARIGGGFTPSREELRGAWLNLRIFKEHLASMRSDSLLLIRHDGNAYHIERTAERNAIFTRKVGI